MQITKGGLYQIAERRLLTRRNGASAKSEGATMRDGMNKDQVGVVQRAFEIARDGESNSVTAIRDALRKEGYDNANHHLAGPTIIRQLKAVIACRKPKNQID